jgi:Winged helix-turn helix
VPVPRARQITLTTVARRRLRQLASSHSAPYQQVIRVRIVLDAAQGRSNATIASRQGVSVDTVRLWRSRYADEGVKGLADRRRSGRPPRLTPSRSPRSRRWPANSRPRPACRCHGIFFSIVQRKVVTPNDFTSLDQVEDRLIAFERRYNATARPFRWKFTPADLEDLLARIERHEQKESNLQHEHDHQPAVPEAA